MGLGRLLLAGVRLEDVPAMLSRLLQVSQADKGLNPSNIFKYVQQIRCGWQRSSDPRILQPTDCSFACVRLT